MRVLVSGAAGFIGSHVCEELTSSGYAIRAVSRPAAARRPPVEGSPDVEVVDCDLTAAGERELQALCEGVDACIHAAWHVVPGQYLTSAKNAEHERTALKLFGTLASQGCRHIVGIGTCFEYRPAAEPLSETAPLDPATPYAAAKRAVFEGAERLFAGSPVAFAWARLFYLYGPREDPRRLVPDVALKLMRGERAAVTSGTQIRDFLHVRDVAGALVAVLRSSLHGPVNIGSGIPVAVADVVRTISDITGRRDLIDFGARADNLADPPYVCADNRRLRHETDWRPRYTLASGLEQTIGWWRTAQRTA